VHGSSRLDVRDAWRKILQEVKPETRLAKKNGNPNARNPRVEGGNEGPKEKDYGMVSAEQNWGQGHLDTDGAD
jgi:hypothetical protein